jgi:meso-butanediol dehydrogenase/(S,S)-butanediol dehydrogenase/diacetyl reductase
MKLTGKMALVTGGGTGIGAAIAKRLVQDGARVCITGRRREMLDQTAKDLPKESVVICQSDVSKYEDVKRMVATALEFGGKLDILVNNASIYTVASITDLDPAEWQSVLDINLTGPFLLMKECIPYMVKNGGGSIINIASLGGVRCLPGSPAYCATKAALIMLTKQVALDYGRYKIRCNAVNPGGVITDMTKKLVVPLMEKLGTDIDGGYKYFSKNVPLQRAGEPYEIASLCSYLASDDSAYMTGAELAMDGGAVIVDIQGAIVSDVLA